MLLAVAEPANAEAGDDPFDRQVRAFGRPGQRVLKALHVGIVGVGGTGSPLFEQLVRLGVGKLTVIDPDTLTAGNVTRVYGSGMADVDRAKVVIAEAHAHRISFGTTVRTLQRSVTALEAAWALRHCDVVFGCTDDNAGRMVLSRLGYWCLMPVIDTGVLIDTASDSGAVSGVFGRVTIVGPGAACLACRSHIDLARAQAEALDPVERRERAAEGYAVGLADPDPSVVALHYDGGRHRRRRAPRASLRLRLDRHAKRADAPAPRSEHQSEHRRQPLRLLLRRPIDPGFRRQRAVLGPEHGSNGLARRRVAPATPHRAEVGSRRGLSEPSGHAGAPPPASPRRRRDTGDPKMADLLVSVRPRAPASSSTPNLHITLAGG